MPTELAVTLEELELAWRRLKGDRPERVFINHPYLVDWIELDIQTWLASLQEQLRVGFIPNQASLCLVPKPGSLLRPALVLEPEDEVVYNVLLGRMYPAIWEAIGHLQEEPNVAYQLTGSVDSPAWIRTGFLIWQQWRLRSVSRLTPDVTHVVETDIAGFYDNLDYTRLAQNLRAVGVEGPEFALLSECLNRWTFPRNRGVPQGYSASDILAKLYMASIDDRLRRDGYVHLRYVDDLRIFCSSRTEARRAIQRITQLGFSHGLSFQSSKTEVHSRTEARRRFDGVDPIIRNVKARLAKEIRGTLDLVSPYLSPGEVAGILSEAGGEIQPKVLERAFVDFFIDRTDGVFEKTLFRYLVNQLARVHSNVAVDYAVDALRYHPEETSHILRYLGAAHLETGQYEKLLSYIESPEALYDYQVYQVVGWHLEKKWRHERILALSRAAVADRNRPQWLRSTGAAYLGELGTDGDLDFLEESYAAARSDVERADCLAGLARLERSRRNSLFGRAGGAGVLADRAISWARRLYP